MVIVSVIGAGVLGSRVAGELSMCGHKVVLLLLLMNLMFKLMLLKGPSLGQRQREARHPAPAVGLRQGDGRGGGDGDDPGPGRGQHLH